METTKSEPEEKECSVQVYTGDFKQFDMKSGEMENVIGETVTIVDLLRMPYEELLQEVVSDTYRNKPFFDSESNSTELFLRWCDGYLIFFSGFVTEESRSLISYLYYTPCADYKDVIFEKVFEEKRKFNIIKSTRPVIKKIVEKIKMDENVAKKLE